MTFASFEVSAENGQPLELYEFLLGAEKFFFTTSEDTQSFAGETYIPVAISRTQINVSPEERTDILTITLPAEEAFARRYIDIVPGVRASLTIKRVHRPDGNLVTFFKGIVRSVGFSQDGVSAQIAVLPLSRGMSRSIPLFLYQGLCNHILYDGRCKIVADTFKFTGTVTVISGATYTIPGLGASVATPATGGFVRVGATDWRLVLSQSGDAVTLLLPFNITDVGIGTSVDVFAGCDHTIGVCKTQFANVLNYGGFAFVPLKNIFATGLD